MSGEHAEYFLCPGRQPVSMPYKVMLFQLYCSKYLTPGGGTFPVEMALCQTAIPQRPPLSLLWFFLFSFNSFRMRVLADYLILNKYLRNEWLNKWVKGCWLYLRLLLGSLLQRHPHPTPSALWDAELCNLQGSLPPVFWAAFAKKRPRGKLEGWKWCSAGLGEGDATVPVCCYSRQHVSMAPLWPFPQQHRLVLVFSLILLSQNQSHLPLEGPPTRAHTHKRTCHSCEVHPHTLEVWI